MTRKLVVLPVALAALGLTVGQAQAKAPPKVKSKLDLGSNTSPLGDYVTFDGSLISKRGACATRTLKIRHVDDGSLIAKVHSDTPFKNTIGSFTSYFDTAYFKIAGNFVGGERIRVSTGKRTQKKGGRVIAVCKPSSKTITLTLEP